MVTTLLVSNRVTESFLKSDYLPIGPFDRYGLTYGGWIDNEIQYPYIEAIHSQDSRTFLSDAEESLRKRYTPESLFGPNTGYQAYVGTFGIVAATIDFTLSEPGFVLSVSNVQLPLAVLSHYFIQDNPQARRYVFQADISHNKMDLFSIETSIDEEAQKGDFEITSSGPYGGYRFKGGAFPSRPLELTPRQIAAFWKSMLDHVNSFDPETLTPLGSLNVDFHAWGHRMRLFTSKDGVISEPIKWGHVAQLLSELRVRTHERDIKDCYSGGMYWQGPGPERPEPQMSAVFWFMKEDHLFGEGADVGMKRILEAEGTISLPVEGEDLPAGTQVL